MMRIAVAYEDGNVARQFGESKFFKLYELEGKAVIRDVVVPAWGDGHEGLASCLREYGANVLICGSLSGSARVALGEAGMLVFGGVIGAADTAVQAFLNGSLKVVPEGHCDQQSCSGSCKGCGECCPGAAACQAPSE